jgi:regulator of replication initiation timing
MFNGCTLLSADKSGDLQAQINTLRMENQSLKEEYDGKLEQLKVTNENLTAQIRHLIEEKQRLSSENQEMMARLDRLEQKTGKGKPPAKSAVTEENRDIKIKVLSGNGDIGSAKKMARRLEEMGYQVSQVDFATRSNFEKDTVFFSKSAEEEAKRLVSSLGSNTTMREITWSSSYEIIVVTGLPR